MGEIRPQGQGHPLGDHLPAEIQPAPGVLPGADAPALKGPFTVEGVVAEAVDDVPGREDRFAAGLHIGGAVGIEIRVTPQVQGIPGDVPGHGKLPVLHDAGRQDVPWRGECRRRVGQPVFAPGNAPERAAFGAVHLALGKGGVHPEPQVGPLRGDELHAVALGPFMVQAQQRLCGMPGAGQDLPRSILYDKFHATSTFLTG